MTMTVLKQEIVVTLPSFPFHNAVMLHLASQMVAITNRKKKSESMKTISSSRHQEWLEARAFGETLGPPCSLL